MVDEEGNVTYLARWKGISEEKTYNVTYIDPATGRIIQDTITVKVGEPEPKAPKDPTREGYTFAGWDRVVDEEGNITYLAKWTPNPDNIKTGDSANIWLWIGLLAAAILAALGFTVARKKKQ